MGNPDRTSSVCESLHPWPILNCSHPIGIIIHTLMTEKYVTMLVKYDV